MRVNVDDVAFMDRRFKLLGGRLGMTWHEALGRCLPVWALAYAKRSAVLPVGDVDALAERPGFGAAMAAAELAYDEPGDRLYLCGVTERIAFLLIQDGKRLKAQQAKLREAGAELPRGPSRGRKAPGSSPGAESPGTVPRDVPGEGPYPPDLDHPHTLDRAGCPPGTVPRDPASGGHFVHGEDPEAPDPAAAVGGFVKSAPAWELIEQLAADRNAP